MTEAFTYKVQDFEGPLDLLLTLIMKNKMDIMDIQITVIFDQYMQHIEQMQQMNMEIAGEFIVMAAELMYIKSRMLLPKTDENEEDPRERLAQALIEYKRAKQAAVYLEEQYDCYKRRMVKDTDEIPSDSRYIAPQDIALLEQAVARLLTKKEREKEPPISNIQPIIQKTIVPVSDKIRDVLEQLHAHRRRDFERLFDRAETKSEVVAIFIAVLSLIKDGHIALEKELVSVRRENAADGEDEYRYRFICSLTDAAEEIDAGAYDSTFQ